jgi:hypothetical protein
MSNKSISDFLASKEFAIKILTTIGDGSCLFHSISCACSQNYQKMNHMQKIQYVRAFRDDLASQVDTNQKLKPILGKYTELHECTLKEMERVKVELEKCGFENITLELLEKKETQMKIANTLSKVQFKIEKSTETKADETLVNNVNSLKEEIKTNAQVVDESTKIRNRLIKDVQELANEDSCEAYISSWFVKHLKSNKQVGYEMIECIARLLEINIYVIEEKAKMQLPSTTFDKSIVVYHSGIQMGHYETVTSNDFSLFYNADPFISYVKDFINQNFIGDEKK